MKKCCFTGRRPKDLCGYEHDNYKEFTKDLANALDDLYKNGVRVFITGGAQGFDQLAFWAVEMLKKQHDDISNVVFVPFKGQEKRWKENGAFGQSEYQKMLGKADSVRYLNEELTEYKEIAKALTDRNKAMVNDSDLVVALYPDLSYRENSGGTAHCMRYAEEKGKPIYQIQYKIKDNKLAFGEICKHNEKTANQQTIEQVQAQMGATAKSMKVRFTGPYANNFKEGDVREVKLLEKGTFDEKLHPYAEGHYLLYYGNVGLCEMDQNMFKEMLRHVDILDDPYELAKPFIGAEHSGQFKSDYEDYSAYDNDEQLSDIAAKVKHHSDPEVKALAPYLEELIAWRKFADKLPGEIKELYCDGVIKKNKEVEKDALAKEPKVQKKAPEEGWVNLAEAILDEIPHEDFDVDFNEPEIN